MTENITAKTKTEFQHLHPKCSIIGIDQSVTDVLHNDQIFNSGINCTKKK